MEKRPELDHRAVIGIVLVCCTLSQTVLPMVVGEAVLLVENSRRDPLPDQREAIEKLISAIPPGEKLAYFTNPSDHVYLAEKILSASADGALEDDLSNDRLHAISRFFRTQYYAAPFHLDLYEEMGETNHVLANFRGQLATSPPYQLDRLRLRMNFGNGIVLYWNETR